MQCARNSVEMGIVELIAFSVFAEYAGFEQGLGQFLNEQRYAIGAEKNLVHHFLRQGLATRHPLDQCNAVAPVKRWEWNRRHVGVVRPRWRKFRSRSDNHQYPEPLHLLYCGDE